MFLHFTKIDRLDNEIQAKMGRYEEQKDEDLYFNYGVPYWLYWDLHRQEVVRSKVDIHYTPNELMKVMVVKFERDKEDYIIDDFRDKKIWI